MTTLIGEYLARSNLDREYIHTQFLEGSLISDYRQFSQKVGVTFTVGVKNRWIGSALIVNNIYPNSVIGTGSWGTNYIGAGQSAWGFLVSGDDS